MRLWICAFAAAAVMAAAQPALAQSGGGAAAFWKAVQTRCDAAAAKPAGDLGQRIARIAIGEFQRFGGHRIDADGRIFRFGLTEAEHEADDGGRSQATLGSIGWWQVMKYWRALYGEDGDAPGKLEVRGYSDATTATQDAQSATLLRTSAAQLLKLADTIADPAEREMLREAAMRAAAVDTSWSAAFVSYVIRQAGVGAGAFQFANAHRAYIYDAFAASAAEHNGAANGGIYRACPLTATRPRPGDLICQQRESALAGESEAAVRERIRGELAGAAAARTVRRTHCEVVAHVDAAARKVYTVGGNVNQSVSARKLNLRGRALKFSSWQKGRCGPGHWTLPTAAGEAPDAPEKCSLNDRKWFVLLQLR